MSSTRRFGLIATILCYILFILSNSFACGILYQVESVPTNTKEQFLPPTDFVTENLKQLGEWDINTGHMGKISTSNNLTFIACYSAGVQILNVSNPTYPQLVLSYEFDQSVFDVVARENLLYLATSEGLRIINFSDLAAIRVVGILELPYLVHCLSISGDFAFIGCFLEIRIIDISDPSTPYLVSSYGNFDEQVQAIQASGQYLYYCLPNKGLSILNITDPTNPIYTANFSSGIEIQDLVIDGTTGYLAATTAGVLCVNLTTITSPELLFSYIDDDSLVDRPTRVAKEGTSLYIYDRGIIRLLDVSNVSSPERKGLYHVFNTIEDFCVAHSIVYLAIYFEGLQVINYTIPESPYLLSSLTNYGEAMHLWINGNIAVIANAFSGIHILNISDPSNPVQISNLRYFMLNAYRVIGIKEALYVLSGFDLFVIDLSDIFNPSIVQRISLAGPGYDLVISGDYLFIPASTSGFIIFDITNRFEPVICSVTTVDDVASGIAIQGDHAFVSTYQSGILIFDVHNPSAPELVHSFGSEFQGCFDICVTDTRAIVISETRDLLIFDIQALDNVKRLYSISHPGSFRWLSIQGDWVYIGGLNLGLKILNLHNLTLPLEIANSEGHSANSYALAINDIIYYADGYAGLRIFQIDLDDSDADYLPNVLETDYYLTDPDNNDTDGDRVLDGLESYRGSNPLDSNDPLGYINASYVIGKPFEIFMILFMLGLTTVVFVHKKIIKK